MSGRSRVGVQLQLLLFQPRGFGMFQHDIGDQRLDVDRLADLIEAGLDAIQIEQFGDQRLHAVQRGLDAAQGLLVKRRQRLQIFQQHIQITKGHAQRRAQIVRGQTASSAILN